MAKKRYKVHKDAGKISREHDEKVLAAMKEVLRQEETANECYSDADLAEMICNSGLLTHKGRIYELRVKHSISNMRERKIINFSKNHKKQ